MRQNEGVQLPQTIDELVRASSALGAATVGALTAGETDLIKLHGSGSDLDLDALRRAIRDGGDPLGDAYVTIMSPEERRPLGQTYTPSAIIASMVKWAQDKPAPARIVDPGAGSGRYLLAAAAAFPEAQVIGLDIDPLAALMLRANAAVTGLGDRVSVVVGDYRELSLPEIDGRTLYIGNPPYVRHHQIPEEWKTWLATTAQRHGIRASKLAGLHIHFFLATAEHGRPGDLGAFITSAEWLDTNYGSMLRQLLLGTLGGTEIHVLEPDASPFADATTTGAITTFEIGAQPESVALRRVATVDALGSLGGGRAVSRARLLESTRWSVLTRAHVDIPEDHIELGELVRVHRGTVTGANRVWVARGGEKLPESVLYPSVTRARELFAAGDRLLEPDSLKRVIDIPVDLDELIDPERRMVDRFLLDAKKLGVPKGYVASARRAWWSVGLRTPAPILATYMARRPPAFVRNEVDARHINIAHGLYPREEIAPAVLDVLAAHLRSAVTLAQGRTYAGGLTKFEPKEMERLTIPTLAVLREESMTA